MVESIGLAGSYGGALLRHLATSEGLVEVAFINNRLHNAASTSPSALVAFHLLRWGRRESIFALGSGAFVEGAPAYPISACNYRGLVQTWASRGRCMKIFSDRALGREVGIKVQSCVEPLNIEVQPI